MATIPIKVLEVEVDLPFRETLTTVEEAASTVAEEATNPEEDTVGQEAVETDRRTMAVEEPLRMQREEELEEITRNLPGKATTKEGIAVLVEAFLRNSLKISRESMLVELDPTVVAVEEVMEMATMGIITPRLMEVAMERLLSLTKDLLISLSMEEEAVGTSVEVEQSLGLLSIRKDLGQMEMDLVEAKVMATLVVEETVATQEAQAAVAGRRSLGRSLSLEVAEATPNRTSFHLRLVALDSQQRNHGKGEEETLTTEATVAAGINRTLTKATEEAMVTRVTATEAILTVKAISNSPIPITKHSQMITSNPSLSPLHPTLTKPQAPPSQAREATGPTPTTATATTEETSKANGKTRSPSHFPQAGGQAEASTEGVT